MKKLENFISILLTLAFSFSISAQEAEKTDLMNELRSEIGTMDHILFDEAFNTCNLDLYKSLTTEDLEFYDDRSGLNQSLEKEIMSFEDRCSRPFSVTRKLVSSEVYRLGDYGAVQIGEHEFYEDDEKVEKSKFITIWERNSASWIMRRAISYDHQSIENQAEQSEVDSQLQDDIRRMDYMLFNEAFNTCNLELYKQVIAPDLEFYDDRTGLNKSFEIEILSFEDRCARPFSVTRRLVSSEVYRLGNYGAVEIGEHEFYEDDSKVEKAKFVIIWEKTNDSWIMKRTISFEHQKVEDDSIDSNTSAYLLRDNYKAILDTLVPELLKEFQAPAAGIGIIRNGKIEFVHVYGENKKGMQAPDNTIFNVASITKPVVAAAVLKLVENGEWDLDEPLYHYFTDPDVVNDRRSRLITTRHCLSHTTGFKNWRREEENGKLQFNFEPGTKFQYSGEGMEYLRHALESKFGVGLEELVDSLVFSPLEMSDATLGWLSSEDTARFASWYDTRGNLHNINPETPKINAADDMLLTVNDILLFSNAILKQELIKGSLYREMVRPQVAINQKRSQGLGWVVYDGLKAGETILNHDGGDPGVIATLILFPASENGIAIFVNSDNGASVTTPIITNIVTNGIDVIEGLHWRHSIPEKVEIDDMLLKRYAGTYTTDSDFSITFNVDGNTLITESDVFPKMVFYPKSENEFFPLPFELYFRFIEEDEKMKVLLLTESGDIDLTGSKKEI